MSPVIAIRPVPAAGVERGLLPIMAVWFALLASFGELATLAVRKFVQHREQLLSPHVVWMTPVADLLAFAMPLVLFLLVWRMRPTPRVVRAACFVFCLLAATSVILMFPRLHRTAVVLLALGVSAQAARLLPLQSVRFRRFMQRSSAIMAVTVLLMGCVVAGWSWWGERRSVALLADAPTGTPNVLLLIWDTVRAASLGLHGYEHPTTPNLERLADEGVVFDWAIATTSWTLPSHAAMFTGRFASELTADYRTPLDGMYPTVAEVLRDRGYLTAGFVGNTYYAGTEFGLDRGFIHYEDYPVSLEELVLSSSLGRTLVTDRRLRRFVGWYDIFGRQSAAEVNRRFLDWTARRGNRPFFAFLNYFDAHEPYLPPAPYDTLFGPATPRPHDLIDYRQIRNGTQWNRGRMSDAEKRAEQAAYDGAIAYLDAQLGHLLDELERRGLRENTIVIVTSDHGEHFGEQGRFMHGNTVLTPVVHVPLVIAGTNRVPRGLRVEDPVTLRDLANTLVHLATRDSTPAFPGRSIARFWASGAVTTRAFEDTVLSEYEEEGLRSLFFTDRHLVRNGSGTFELYDYRNDRLELHDLARGDSADLTIARLAAPFQELFARGWLRDRYEPLPPPPVSQADPP